MSKPPNPSVSTIKMPKQARSTALVEAVLEAAVQVLRAEGAARFTTARVAERAGVSVGSIYQYFPNKASILFRLQSDEWRTTSELLRGILEDSTLAVPERLRALVHAFIRSECDEAQVRLALNDAAPLYRDAPEAEVARADGSVPFHQFIRSALPDADEATCELTADLLETTLTEVGRSFSEVTRSEAEIVAYSDAMANMFCAYLGTLEGRVEA